MRITFVISSLAAGGAQRVVVDLMRRLADTGHVVTLITYSTPSIDHFSSPASVTRISLDLLGESTNVIDTIKSSLSRLRKLRAAITQSRSDIIVSFIDLTNILTIAATRGLGTPVVISERIDPRYHFIQTRWKIARRMLYPFCDTLVVQTPSVAGWARSVVRSSKIQIIPNSAPSTVPTTEPRERFVLSLGRLHRQKGVDLLLRAFSTSNLAADGWSVVLVGDGPERLALEQLAFELRIKDQVVFQGVSISPENWLARCGIFVLSSRFEGFPNVLLEAMAAGAPAIAFDCPSGPADIIDQCRTGVLVPAEDHQALALELRRLATDEGLRTSIGLAGKEVVERFSADKITAQWESLLRSLVPETGTRVAT